MTISVKEKLDFESESANWLIVDRCPSCKSQEAINRGEVPLDFYYFSGKKIVIRAKHIAVWECKKCGLLYKNKVPSPEFISQLISSQSNRIWSYQYKYEDEIQLINDLFSDRSSYDLLDIGAANGDLLRHSAKFGGRRSALDIARYPDSLFQMQN